MTTKHLIEILKDLDPDGTMEVCLDDGWGDSFDSVRVETPRNGKKFIAII